MRSLLWLAACLAAAGLLAAQPCPALAADGDKIVVWDGEKEGGAGWAGPENAKNTIKVQKDTVHEGKAALAYHAEGKEWMGCGWNWHGWWPEDAGTDITKFANLVFWAKLDGDMPDNLKVALTSNNKKATAQVDIKQFCDALGDGKWHEVVVPIKTLLEAEKTEFDPKKAWEINIHTWSPGDKKLTLFLDDFGFDNRKAAK